MERQASNSAFDHVNVAETTTVEINKVIREWALAIAVFCACIVARRIIREFLLRAIREHPNVISINLMVSMYLYHA